MMRLWFVLCCTLALAGPAAAQAPRLAPPRLALAPDARLAPFRAPHARAPNVPVPGSTAAATRDGRRGSVPGLVAAGILGGGVGLVGGAFVGAWGGDFSCDDRGNADACDAPVILGAMFGGVAGEALLLPLAEHLAGGRRGPLGKELLVSIALAGAGLGLLWLTDFDGPTAPATLVTVPLAQLVAVTALERR
ncbi:MAG: hypothetical protein IRZ00_08040 [Gemmatimonadetes bacterium]|nr:hypothetical protein [Gemmatimonadota bacterium]